MTVAGGNGITASLLDLNSPYGLDIDDRNQSIVIADTLNNRIVEWKNGATTGELIAGGQGFGNRLDQLYFPPDVLIDKETNSLFICDRRNRRVVQWSRRQETTQGELILDNIECLGLAMDHKRYLYVSDTERDEVRRYSIEGNNETVVAGGNGEGNQLNQLNYPAYLFVDRQQALFVSDYNNHRVMRWNRGANQGIVVAGGQGEGVALNQLSPTGLLVDTSGTIYVADAGNNRLMRWRSGTQQGTIIAGGNGEGRAPNQLRSPNVLCFDSQHNLYVTDRRNHRVQRFDIQ